MNPPGSVHMKIDREIQCVEEMDELTRAGVTWEDAQRTQQWSAAENVPAATSRRER